MSLMQETVRLLVVVPSFPTRACGIRQDSEYLENTLKGLAEKSGAPVRVLTLQRKGELALERGEYFDVTRVHPASPVSDVALSSPDGTHDMLALAEAAALAVEDIHEERRIPVAWVYGSECAFAASVMRRAGAAVVGVIHRLRVEELLHALGAPSGTTSSRILMSLLSRSTRDRLVHAFSALSGALRKVSLPSHWGQEIEQLNLERRLMKASHSLVSVGDHFQQTCMKHYPDTFGKWTVASPGANVGPFEKRQAPRSRRRLLMTGNGHPLQGLEALVQALETMHEMNNSLAEMLEVLILLGPSVSISTECRDVLDRLYALPSVQWVRTQSLAHEEFVANLKECDGFLQPSLVESSAEKVLTAMAMGVPVLASYADGPRDVLDGNVALRADLTSPGQRATQLEKMLTQFLALSNERLARMSQRALTMAAEWTWENCANAHWEACLKAISRSQEIAKHVGG